MKKCVRHDFPGIVDFSDLALSFLGGFDGFGRFDETEK